MNKKVLLITYYWPPAGGSGVQRWLKFVKYLPDFGIDPVVYIPENPEYPVLDYSLNKDVSPNITVLKKKIWEPYQIYKWITGKKATEKIQSGEVISPQKKGVLNKFSAWVRSHFFIPDARVFWVKPSVSFLTEYLSKNPIDLIISSGPPHSLHLIVLKLKKRFSIPWIADMRDPWTDIFYYHEFNHSIYSKRKDLHFEKKVLNGADIVTTVSFGLKELFDVKLNPDQKKDKIKVITNGFDQSDFEGLSKIKNAIFTIGYTGQLLHSYNPYPFFDVLNNLYSEGLQFRLVLTGKTGIEVKEYLMGLKMKDSISLRESCAHKESIQLLYNSHILFLCIPETANSKGILTGKIFEYIASGTPIINLSDQLSETSMIIKETNSGKSFQRKASGEMADFIKSIYQRSEQDLRNTGYLQYERKELTRKLADIIGKLT